MALMLSRWERLEAKNDVLTSSALDATVPRLGVGLFSNMRRGPKRIALLIESSRAYGRGLLRGIAAYIRSNRTWTIYHDERALGDRAPEWLGQFHGDGIIARIESRTLAEEVTKLDLPTVDLRGRYDIAGVPVIDTDDSAVVRVAYDHLMKRGFYHFGYCGFAGADYSERRKAHAVEYLAKFGIIASIFDSRHSRAADTAKIEAKGYLNEGALAEWLKGLRKPVALLACNDARAHQVLCACRDTAIRVPDEVAVVGVDDDEIICELADPPLTSIRNDTERIGYDAAALLAQMMTGAIPQQQRTLVRPVGIVARQSSDIFAVQDDDVAAAVRFIRDHAFERISVNDIVENLSFSRSTLERKFIKYLGRAPGAEIMRLRIERVKQLLIDTNLTLSNIARMAGFSYQEHMCTQFKKITGETPGQYREVHLRAKNDRTLDQGEVKSNPRPTLATDQVNHKHRTTGAKRRSSN